MARPKNQDPQNTKASILKAASQHFAERGFASARIRDIAADAAVSVATTTHHFGSKEKLYEACVENMYESLQLLHQHLRKHFLENGPSLKALDEGVRLAFRFAKKRRSTLRLILREVIKSGEVRRERLESHLVPFLDEGVELLAHASTQDLTRLRMSLHTLNHVFVRYALMSANECRYLVNEVYQSTSESDEVVDAHIEEHLVYCTLTLLGLPSS